MLDKNFSDAVSDLKALVQASLEDGKAQNIVVIDLKGKTDIADYMVIATGTSNKHTGSLAENLVQKIKDSNLRDVTIEGLTAGDWVLVDAGEIVVHIFKSEVRELYNLEKMWAVPLPEPEMATTH